jgi:hypothetical protein
MAQLQSTSITGSLIVTGGITGSISGSIVSPGSTTQVLYNNGGVVAGSSGFVYSGSYVGIGTTTPTAPVDTNGVRLGRNWAISNRADIRLDSNGVDYPADILFGHTAAANQTSWDGVYWSISSRAAENNNLFTIWRGAGNPGGSGEAIVFSIKPDGNVGIGTTTPSQKLDVAGQAAIGSGAQAIVGTDGTYAGYSTIGFGGTTNGYNRVFGNNGTGDGLYLAAATSNGIWFWTNGSNLRMHISPAGLVGIGTATPGRLLNISGNGTDGTQVQINGTSDSAGIKFIPLSGDNWEIQANTSNQWFVYNRTDSEYRLLIDGSGNVGIGTTSPSAKLHVVGNQSILSNYGVGSFQVYNYQISTGTSTSDNQTFSLYLGRFGNGYHKLIFWASGYGTDTGASIEMTTDWGSSVAPKITTSTGLSIGAATFTIHYVRVDYGSYDLFIKYTAGMPTGYANTINYDIISNTGTGYTQFTYASGVTVPTLNSGNLVASITTFDYDTGRVGIGTTSPGYKLDVQSGSVNFRYDQPSSTSYTYFRNWASGGSVALLLGTNTDDDSNAEIIFSNNTLYLQSYGDPGSSIQFGTRNSSTSAVRMTINQDGNVGIGTTSPAYTLDVAGTSRSDMHIFRSNQSAPTADAFIFRPADNTVALGTANTERMRITSTGALLIGTSATTNTASGKIVNLTAGSSLLDLTLNGGAWSIASIGGEPALYLSSNIVAATGLPSATQTAKGGMGFEYVSSAAPTDIVLGIFGSPTVASSVRFFNNTERMRITSGGNILMNTTTSPTTGGFTNTTLNIKQLADGLFGGGLHIEENGTTSVAYFGFDGATFRIGTSYRTTGDYRPISFATSGTERLRIANDGNVGIGTSSPATKLDLTGTLGFTVGSTSAIIRRTTVNGSNGIVIQGNANDTVSDTNAGAYIYVGGGVLGDTYEGNIDFTAYGSIVDANRNQIRFFNRSGVNTVTERMRINHIGNVGIGTASPGYKLDVSGVTSTQGLYIPGLYTFGQSQSGIEMQLTSTSYNAIRFYQGTDWTGVIHSFGRSWAGGVSVGMVNIEGYNGVTIGAWNIPTATFLSSGNVGIGTTNPTWKLTILGNNDIFNVTSQTADTSLPTKTLAAFNGIYNSGGNGHNLYISSTAGTGPWEFNTTKTWGGFMSWGVSSNGTSITRHMSLTDAGNVGIGTTTPSQKLEVSGGDALIRTAYIGNISAYGTSYASFSHTSRAGAGEYSFLSGNAGETYINAKTSNPIYFRINNVNKVIISDAGYVGIGTATPGVPLEVVGAISGSSINFGQNDLNFYEENTWTPAIETVNNNIGTVNYSGEPIASYTRIGNVVHTWFTVDISSIGGIGTGTGKITGLPYTAASNGAPFTAVILDGSVIISGAAGEQLKGYIDQGSDFITLYLYDSGTGGYGPSADARWQAGGGIISGYVSYQV